MYRTIDFHNKSFIIVGLYNYIEKGALQNVSTAVIIRRQIVNVLLCFFFLNR